MKNLKKKGQENKKIRLLGWLGTRCRWWRRRWRFGGERSHHARAVYGPTRAGAVSHGPRARARMDAADSELAAQHEGKMRPVSTRLSLVPTVAWCCYFCSAGAPRITRCATVRHGRMRNGFIMFSSVSSLTATPNFLLR
jgi:hypothetical protein